MLVIISDLHLTDGTSGETIDSKAFRIFRERLSDLAYDASWRTGGVYRPIERLDLLLLGDILDPIRSTKWLYNENKGLSQVRPWDDPTSRPFVDKVKEITAAILNRNEDSLKVLRGFTSDRPVTVPPATRSGRPRSVSHDQRSPAREPVEVRIHYMVGNHDWFYHLPGPGFDQIRNEIVQAMGLVNDPTLPFPHDPADSDVIQTLCDPYQVFARHGDIFDSFNFEEDRNAASLGDAIVVELLNRFAVDVQYALGEELPSDFIDGLKEIDNVRPKIVIPIWINSLLSRTVRDKRKIQQVKDIWDDMADDFLNLPFVRSRDKALDFFDDVDKLEWALKFSQGLSFQTISQVATWIKQKVMGGETTHHKVAFSEPAFRNKSARFIVHGHTHHFEIVPLDTVITGGRRLEQMYLNSGTWRPVHELARFSPGDQEFMGYHVMTYFAFFKGDERNGRPFEVWTGALGR